MAGYPLVLLCSWSSIEVRRDSFLCAITQDASNPWPWHTVGSLTCWHLNEKENKAAWMEIFRDTSWKWQMSFSVILHRRWFSHTPLLVKGRLGQSPTACPEQRTYFGWNEQPLSASLQSPNILTHFSSYINKLNLSPDSSPIVLCVIPPRQGPASRGGSWPSQYDLTMVLHGTRIASSLTWFSNHLC